MPLPGDGGYGRLSREPRKEMYVYTCLQVQTSPKTTIGRGRSGTVSIAALQALVAKRQTSTLQLYKDGSTRGDAAEAPGGTYFLVHRTR